MFLDTRPACLPDFLILRDPQSVLNFVFAGVPSSSLLHIHHLRIQFPFSYDSRSPKHETYLIAIRIILRIVPNLGDLVLLWAGVPARVFDGVSFRLEALTCTMQVDQDAMTFIESQPDLRLVELPRWFKDSLVGGRPLTLPQGRDFLPNVCEVSAPPPALMRVIPGRPVRSVDIRLTPEDEDEEEGLVKDWDVAMRTISQSVVPVEDLAIATLDDFSLDVLRALVHLPSLKTLYLRVYSPTESSTDIFQWGRWAPYLAQLSNIETIKVEFDCRYLEPCTNARFAIPTLKSIRRWAQTCPQLCAVYVGLYAGDALVIWEQGRSVVEV